ncbi:MAG: hypothetical protein WCK29_01420 [archaeon]
MKKTVALALILFTLFVINVLAIGLLSANDSVANIDKAKNLTIVTVVDNKSSNATTQQTTSNNPQPQTNTVTQPNPTPTPTPTVVRVTRAS